MLVRCPAKVNLFLSVGPRDESGLHPLRTVFQAVGLYDELRIEEADEDSVECDWAGLPSDNTVTKALRLLRELVPLPPLRISLTKRIPAESGLGGGSTDAAGLIRAARKMMPDHCSEQFGREVAAAIGADVPFFLVGGRAKGTGYGETIEPLPDPEPEWMLIVKPDEGVSTVAAYAALDRGVQVRRPAAQVGRAGQDDVPKSPQSVILSGPKEPELGDSGMYNDFERVAPCVCGDIAERLQAHGAKSALLAGSGSAVFGVFETEQQADKAEEKIRAENLGQTWKVESLTREDSLWTS